MKNIICQREKSSRYAVERKATYTYRVFTNGAGTITISVQKTKDFNNCTFENENVCTMAVSTYDRMSLEDVNWIFYFLRTSIKNNVAILACEIDETGKMTAEEHYCNMTGYIEKQFELIPAVDCKFEVGKKYTVVALYGGFRTIEILSRTADTVTYCEVGHPEEVETETVGTYTGIVYGKELEEIGTVTCETILAWEYHSPYAKDESDIDRSYFTAFDFDQLYTPERLAEITGEADSSKKYFTVNYKNANGVWAVDVVKADAGEAVKDAYNKYEVRSLQEITGSTIEYYLSKYPVIEIETEPETETEPESLTEDEKCEIAFRMNEEFAAYGAKEGYIILPDQVTESAKYRVDSFQNGEHYKEIFQNPTVARWVAEDRKKAGFHVFLLKEVINNLYDVIEEL